MHRYRVHGLELASEIPITGRPSAAGLSELSVRLAKTAPIPKSPPPGALLLAREADGQSYSITREASGQHRIRFGQLADFALSSDRRSCLVTPDRNSVPGYAEVLLVGNVLAVVLALDGRPTLHASAVMWHDVGVAFAGPSHSGKTRLAAALCQRGARLVTDDTLRVGVGRDARVEQWPGSTALRLRCTLDAAPAEWSAAQSADGRTLTFPPLVKDVQPLHHLCLLHPASGRPGLSPLQGGRAFAQLHANMRITGWNSGPPLRDQFEATRELFPKLRLWKLQFDPRQAPDAALTGLLFNRLIQERCVEPRRAL